MTKEEFQESSVNRVNEILGERANEIEVFIAGLVGLGFSEGVKHAIRSEASREIIRDWARRLAVMQGVIENLKKDFDSFLQTGIKPTHLTFVEWLEWCRRALREVPKGGGE